VTTPPDPATPPPFRLGGPSGRRPPVLQNMSCRPTVAVEHQGGHAGRVLRFGFAAPSGQPVDLSVVMASLGLVDRPDMSMGRQVHLLAMQPSPLLDRLPAVAAVRANAEGEMVPGLTDQPLLILAVPTRCSDRVFLRDREPAVSLDRLCRSITLLLPPSWSHTS